MPPIFAALASVPPALWGFLLRILPHSSPYQPRSTVIRYVPITMRLRAGSPFFSILTTPRIYSMMLTKLPFVGFSCMPAAERCVLLFR